MRPGNTVAVWNQPRYRNFLVRWTHGVQRLLDEGLEYKSAVLTPMASRGEEGARPSLQGVSFQRNSPRGGMCSRHSVCRWKRSLHSGSALESIHRKHLTLLGASSTSLAGEFVEARQLSPHDHDEGGGNRMGSCRMPDASPIENTVRSPSLPFPTAFFLLRRLHLQTLSTNNIQGRRK